MRLILENSYNKYLRIWNSFNLKIFFFLIFILAAFVSQLFFKFVSKFSLFIYFWIVSLARDRVSDLIIPIIISSFTAGGSRRPSDDRNDRRLFTNRIIKSAFRRHIICQRCARRYLIESDKIFYYTRSEKNIPYSYYTARKQLYLFIPDPLINIIINLQFKIDRLIADSSSITESVII
jgi:hypothetical protein